MYFLRKIEYVWPHWVQSNLEKITDSESLKNDSSRVVDNAELIDTVR